MIAFCLPRATWIDMALFGSRLEWSSRATPQDSWRYLKMALECPAESSFRAVPESISCLTRAHALLTNPAPGEGHPPPCHVLHGSHPYQSGESLSKDRSRQVDFPREGGHGPGLLGTTMNQREHMPNVRITQRSQPAESPVLVSLQPCSDGLEHEDVRQARRHGNTAWSQGQCLRTQHFERRVQPGMRPF